MCKPKSGVVPTIAPTTHAKNKRDGDPCAVASLATNARSLCHAPAATARVLSRDQRESFRMTPGPRATTKPASMSDPPEIDRGDATYRVQLPSFEGPLDLLLHLVQKHELAIADLPVSFITEKYLEYIEMMKVLQIDVASEYLVMAATLVHLKSKTLLPPDPKQDAEEGVEGEE